MQDNFIHGLDLPARLGLEISDLAAETCTEGIFLHALHQFCNLLQMQCIHLMSINASSSEEAPAPDFSMSTFPRTWDEAYFNEQRWQYDPVYNYIHRELKRQPVVYATWTEAFENEIELQRCSGREQLYIENISRIFADTAKFDINSGVFIAKQRQQKLLLYMSSSESPEALEDRFNPGLWAMLYSGMLLLEDLLGKLQVNHENRSITTRSNSPVNLTLSKREREIMQFFLNHPDTTINAVAQAHHISENTVNFHLKQVRKKLDNRKGSGRQLASLLRNMHLI